MPNGSKMAQRKAGKRAGGSVGEMEPLDEASGALLVECLMGGGRGPKHASREGGGGGLRNDEYKHKGGLKT